MFRATLAVIWMVTIASGQPETTALPNLLDLAKSLNLTKFVEYAINTGLDRLIRHEGKFTIFAPTDLAFENEVFYPGETNLKDKLKFHITWGEVKSAAIQNEMTLMTALPKRRMRLNVYPSSKVITASGRPIISVDHVAHNGVIHVLSEVISSVYKRDGSVISEIEDCCPHHSQLIKYVMKAGLYDALDKNGPFTFLAPDNGAFAKLHPDFINHLMKNITALQQLLLSHVVPGTIYSHGIRDGDALKTISGSKVKATWKAGSLMLGDAQVQLMDIVAANGAVHTIDTVLFPKSLGADGFRKVPDVTQEDNIQLLSAVNKLMHLDYRLFSDALQLTGVDRLIEESPIEVTILAVPDAAFKAALKDRDNQQSLVDYVKSHIIPGIFDLDMLENEYKLDTLTNGGFLWFNRYEENFGTVERTVNGQFLEPTTHKFKNGLIQGLKNGLSILHKPYGTVMEELQKNSDLSAFHGLMLSSPLGRILDQNKHYFTVFAPTNEVVEALEKSDQMAAQLFADVFIPKIVFSSGLLLSDSLYSIGGKRLIISKGSHGEVRVDGLEGREMDLSATNGVIHKMSLKKAI